MNHSRRTLRLASVLLIVILAGLATACGSAGVYHYDTNDVSYDRWVSGYVYDYDYDNPISGALISIEDCWSDNLYTGYTDIHGYFEIYVGDWFDYEDVEFRAYRVSKSGYDTYYADEYWYSFNEEITIYTGEYYLDPFYW